MQTTIHKSEIPAVGTALAGGFATGLYRCGDTVRLLITAGKEAEVRGSLGTYGEDVAGARSFTDGLANTNAFAETVSELAQRVRAMRFGDCDDWALPSSHQQELQYRAFKPTSQVNYCSWRDGENAAAIPPTLPYTEESPAQTHIEAFQSGGAEAFEPRWYLSSTQCSPFNAWSQLFDDGNQSYRDKDSEGAVRPVRSLLVTE